MSQLRFETFLLDALMEESRLEANKRLEDLQRRACPPDENGEADEHRVLALQDAIQWVAFTKADGIKPTSKVMRKDMLRPEIAPNGTVKVHPALHNRALYKDFSADVEKMLDVYGQEIVDLGLELHRIRKAQGGGAAC